jgi:hypothetical protein
MRLGAARTFLLIAVAAFLLLLYRARQTRLAAQNLMTDLRSLEVGQSSFQEILSLRQKYASYVLEDNRPQEACTPNQCKVSFGFKNWPAYLRLHESGMAAGLSFQNGSLQEIYVGASCAGAKNKPPFVPTFVVMIDRDIDNPPGVYGVRASTSNGYSFRVGPGSRRDQIAKLYSLNFDILQRFGVCRSLDEMFAQDPALWLQSVRNN